MSKTHTSLFLLLLTAAGAGPSLAQQVKNPAENPAALASVSARASGAVGDGKADDTESIQKALDTGMDVFLPKGTYRISKSLVLKNNSLRGEGQNRTYINVTGNCHGIIVPNHAFPGREAKDISGFSIGSYGGQAGSKYAIFFEGTPPGNPASYNASLNIKDLEIGGKGTFGGGIYLTDAVRITISDVGMTFVNNPLSLIGSVIQSVISNVTCYREQNFRYQASDGIPNTGVVMDYRKDYANSKLMGPESTKLTSCSFVRYDVGVDFRFGLFAVFDKLDIDFYATTGFLLRSESCRILNSWFATETTSAKAVAIRLIPSGFTPGDLFIQNNQINAYNKLHPASNAIELGDNGQGPGRFSWGAHITSNMFSGPKGSWNIGIQADRTRGIVIRDNVMADGLCNEAAANLTNCRHGVVSGNIFQTGIIRISSPFNDGFGSVTDNNAVIEQGTMANTSNWSIARNISFSK
ncbi:MAG: hypothetical protein J7576_21490 [Siphonobacter aquaeclarae]|nr:hypothetical protein [Siphonobacter aquaeclarae]